MDKKLLKPDEVDLMLRYPLGRTLKLAKAGKIKIPFVRLPDGEIRFDHGAVAAFLTNPSLEMRVAELDTQIAEMDTAFQQFQAAVVTATSAIEKAEADKKAARQRYEAATNDGNADLMAMAQHQLKLLTAAQRGQQATLAKLAATRDAMLDKVNELSGQADTLYQKADAEADAATERVGELVYHSGRVSYLRGKFSDILPLISSMRVNGVAASLAVPAPASSPSPNQQGVGSDDAY